MKSPPPTDSALENSEYSRLHSLIFRPVISEEREEEIIIPQHDARLIVRQVETGEARMAIVMRPVPLSEFVAIVTRGWRLPPKATNFFPKPPAGAVIQQHGERL